MNRNTIDYIALGKQVRRHRKSKGISQTELAERVKISPQHLSHIETGRTRASLPVVVEIANALEIDANTLLWADLKAVRTQCQCSRIESMVMKWAQKKDKSITQILNFIEDVVESLCKNL